MRSKPVFPAGRAEAKVLIAMAGLPGTGKSSLAAGLSKEIGAVVLDKDRVRAVLFPPAVLDYSAGQDDICMAAIYQATGCILDTFPRQAVIVDGRTFLRAGQVQDLLAFAASRGETPRLIECTCADEVAHGRLESDRVRGEHPAGNRSYALYQTLKATAEPITVPHLVLDTGQIPFDECLRRCLASLECGKGS
jgi:predicted kinase